MTKALDAVGLQRRPIGQASKRVNERPLAAFWSFVRRLRAWPAATRRRVERGVSGMFFFVSLWLCGQICRRISEMEC